MSTNLGGSTSIASQDLFTTSTTQQHVLGEKVFSPDGRAFRYVQAGAAALVPGQVVQSSAIVTNHVNLTPTANAAVGDRTFTVTLGATAATANQYAGGYLVIELGTTGAGQTLLIKSHPAANASATLTLTLEDPFQIATSGTVTADLIANRYSAVINTPTTATANIVGVSTVAIPANAYGWIQTRGIAGVLTSGTPAAGTGVGAGTTLAGAVLVNTATLQPMGTVAKTAITSQYTPVYLTID